MSELALNKEFEEKLYERLRTDIGSLMSDDQLKLIIQRAIEKSFFEPRREQRKYGSDILHPPLIQEIVTEVLRDQVKEITQIYVRENADKIIPLVEAYLKDGGQQMIIGAIATMFSASLDNLKHNIMADLSIPR